LTKFGLVRFEIRERTDEQTDKQTINTLITIIRTLNQGWSNKTDTLALYGPTIPQTFCAG